MQYLKLILHLSSQDQCLPSFKIAECLFTYMFDIMLNLIEQSLITPMPRPWIDHGHSWFCHVCSQDFLMSNSVCNNTLDKQTRWLLPMNKNMIIWEETRYRLYIFIKKTTTTTDTTMRANDMFCPLPRAWHVNCPFNCPITLSNYKHDAYTVLLVLISGWWWAIMLKNFVTVLINRWKVIFSDERFSSSAFFNSDICKLLRFCKIGKGFFFGTETE